MWPRTYPRTGVRFRAANPNHICFSEGRCCPQQCRHLIHDQSIDGLSVGRVRVLPVATAAAAAAAAAVAVARIALFTTGIIFANFPALFLRFGTTLW